MEIVTDTSVLIAVITGQPEKAQLVELTRGADLITPHPVHWEIGNALSAMFKRQRITLAQALQAAELYKKIPLRFVEIELEESLQLAKSLGIYAYDAYLIRCALKYRAPLLSLDKSLVTFARAAKASVMEVM